MKIGNGAVGGLGRLRSDDLSMNDHYERGTEFH